MQTIDLTAAMTRLLENGALRDVFAANPEAAAKQLKVCRADIPAFLRLRHSDLEYQSDILLRKRLARIKRLLPSALQQTDLWPSFRAYARTTPPRNDIADAHALCHLLAQNDPAIKKSREWNRLEFATRNKQLSAHLTRHPKNNRRCLQILYKTSTGNRSELILSVERLW